MADEPSTAGTRFADDLRRIREARGITVDEVHKHTRIARTLIESFEEGQLYEHPTYNRVYLRSFIKAYADAVSISREEALKGLDAALEGAYQHALAEEYLDSGPSDREPPSEAPADEDESTAADDSPRQSPDGPTAGGPEGRGGIVGPPRAMGDEPDEAEIPTDQPPPETVSGSSEDVIDDDAPDTDATASPSDASDPSDASEAIEEDQRQEESADPEWPTARSVDEEAPDAPTAAGSEEEESAPTGAPDLSGPEALRSTPDEADDAGPGEEDAGPGEEAGADEPMTSDADEDSPSWMTDESDASAPNREPAASGPQDPPALDEGTGIVGEPTELGSGGAAAPSDAPSSPTPPSRTAGDNGLLGGVFDGDNQRMLVTGIGFAVVLLVLVGLGVAYFSSGGDEPTPTSAEPTATAAGASAAMEDTATASTGASADTTTSPESRPPPADVRLGPQINLLVLADSNVSALRIQRDDDLRRPYWIEEGEASLFPFEDRAIISSEYDDIRLYIEGYRYPVVPADTVGGLELTRARVQAFVDTLRGRPPSLSVSPDTIPVGEPDS
jgi:cytoskeletal protein RodZ